MKKWIDEQETLQRLEQQMIDQIKFIQEQLGKLQFRKAYVQGAIDALNESENLTHGD